MALSNPRTTASSPSPSHSTSQSLIKRPASSSSDAALLMPPPPPPKRIKRPATVLDEDEYTDALSHIIARDFFPGLLETQTQREYLDALESRDKEWIRRAGKNLEQVMTPRGGGTPGSRRSAATRFERVGSATPVPPGGTTRTPKGDETPRGGGRWVGAETPVSVAGSTYSERSEGGGNGDSSSKMVDVRNMSLSTFQTKYTSEDNESFNKLLDKQNVKREEKYAWMWNGNKILTPRQIAYRKREAERTKALPTSSSSSSSSSSALITTTAPGGDNGNNNKQLITTDQDARPAKPDAWSSKPENPLIFIPSSIEDTHETVAQKAESTSRAGPKQVVYSNTRVQPIPQQPDSNNSNDSVPPSPSLSAIRDAIAGRPRPTDSEPGYTGGETPRVNGYAFVDEDEPDPAHSNEDEEDNSAYHLSLIKMHNDPTSSSATPNPFTIRENRRRELLHHRMVERVATNKRAERAGREGKTPVPKFPSSPMIAFGRTPGGGGGGMTPGLPGKGSGKGLSKASLTPAAQRLWAAVGSTPRRRDGGEGKSEMGREMWTPRATPKGTPRRK
ncbi:hypothetical protein AJ79_00539 [Helicocarpus griseus UAMH5409]|uniref:Nuclear protein DGCR14 n=1 Tax=Helicocarpus griseus UAMH5409 TaxID=1447875 RepID=A0A2B7YBF3_9EURO|nr:hypothetical protein AJ79_00539 [Helicocarpus griseus UAMH5409]